MTVSLNMVFSLYYRGNLVSWCSKKQRFVARSSTGAEYRALSFATTEIICVEKRLHEVHVPLKLHPILLCDNLCATFYRC